MNTFSVSSSDIQKKYREVVDRVRATRQPAVLMNKKEPQAVIVSLEDFEQLQEFRRRNSGRVALKLVQEVRELLRDEHLPSDLAERHDYYLWEEQVQ